jgi:hypothetical protein
MSRAETRIVADAKEESVQSRVRVIGKIETRLMFFVACLVPKPFPKFRKATLVLVIAAAA